MDPTQIVPVPVPPRCASPTGLIILSVFLVLAIIGLVIWIIYLYRMPAKPCTGPTPGPVPSPNGRTGSIPVFLYGFNNASGLCTTVNSVGYLNQTGTTLQISPGQTLPTVLTAQWYMIDAGSGNINLMNGSTGTYITTGIKGADGSYPLATTTNKASATAFKIIYYANRSNTIAFRAVNLEQAPYLHIDPNNTNNVNLMPASQLTSDVIWISVPVLSELTTAFNACS